ncbi:hypothetical protein D3C71_1108040 [compost metagenome]
MRRGKLPAFNDQRNAQPQAFLDQPLIDGGDDHDHRQSRTACRDMPVGDDGNAAFLSRKSHNLTAEAVDCLPQGRFIGVRNVEDRRIEHFETANGRLRLLANAQHVEVGQDRRAHDDLAGLLCTAVRLCAESHAQRHAIGLTNAVERRVGDLREALREILGNPAFLIGKRVDGVAVTHGRNFFRAGG